MILYDCPRHGEKPANHATSLAVRHWSMTTGNVVSEPDIRCGICSERFVSTMLGELTQVGPVKGKLRFK